MWGHSRKVSMCKTERERKRGRDRDTDRQTDRERERGCRRIKSVDNFILDF